MASSLDSQVAISVGSSAPRWWHRWQQCIRPIICITAAGGAKCTHPTQCHVPYIFLPRLQLALRTAHAALREEVHEFGTGRQQPLVHLRACAGSAADIMAGFAASSQPELALKAFDALTSAAGWHDDRKGAAARKRQRLYALRQQSRARRAAAQRVVYQPRTPVRHRLLRGSELLVCSVQACGMPGAHAHHAQDSARHSVKCSGSGACVSCCPL